MVEHIATVPHQEALPAHDLNTQPLDKYDELGWLAEPLRVNAYTVAHAAEAGIPLARDIIILVAEALGVGLVNIIHIFNPDTIILGGGVMQMGRMLMEPALRIVQERTMKAPLNSVHITLTQLASNAGLVGAGALIYSNTQNT